MSYESDLCPRHKAENDARPDCVDCRCEVDPYAAEAAAEKFADRVHAAAALDFAARPTISAGTYESCAKFAILLVRAVDAELAAEEAK
jgi:hypothetical protein